MRPRGIEIRAQDGDVMRPALRAAQLECVDFGPGPMTREIIVDGVEDPHADTQLDIGRVT
jgi:hypothetical protein